jgi:hypothetical protein
MDRFIKIKEQFYMKEEDMVRLLSESGISFSYDPTCSICSENATDCEHWFDDEGFYIIATNIKLDSVVSLLKEEKDE